jgi:hypothetical protein
MLMVPAQESAAHKRRVVRPAYANMVDVRQLLEECRCLLDFVVIADSSVSMLLFGAVFGGAFDRCRPQIMFM